AVKGSAVGRIGAAGVLVSVECIQWVMMEDDRGKVLHRLGTVRILPGDFENGAAGRGDFDALKTARQAGQLIREREGEIKVLQFLKGAAGGDEFIVLHIGSPLSYFR